MEKENARTLLDALLKTARETLMVMEDDFAPMLTYRPVANDQTGIVAMMIGDERLATMVKSALIQIYAKIGPAEWVAVTGDAWSKMSKEKEELNNLQHGDLKKAFEDGDEDVVETLIVHLKWKDGSASAMQSHRYLPTEGWEWDEPKFEVDNNEVEGMVSDVLNAFFKVTT